MQEIGAYGGRRVNAEQKYEQRSHERSPADAGEPDDHADGEAGDRLRGFEHALTIGCPGVACRDRGGRS